MTNTGTVKWFDCNLGKGLITDSEGKEIEVHYNDIITDGLRILFNGDIVLYTLKKVNRRFHARDIILCMRD